MKQTAFSWRARSGMTLVETLVAVLMVVLLTTMVAAGMAAAVRVRAQSTFVSGSQQVADTIGAALSDVLRYATDVETDGEGAVSAFTNVNYGVTAGQIYVGAGDEDGDRGVIYLNAPGAAKKIPLLTNPSYSGLAVVPEDFDSDDDSIGGPLALRYSDGVFSGIYRLYDSAGGKLSEPIEFTFRALNG